VNIDVVMLGNEGNISAVKKYQTEYTALWDTTTRETRLTSQWRS